MVGLIGLTAWALFVGAVIQGKGHAKGAIPFTAAIVAFACSVVALIGALP